MSNNKPITVAEAARLFGFVAAAMVIVLLAISMEGEPAPVRPAWTLSEGLQRDLWRWAVTLLAGGLIIALVALVVRRRPSAEERDAWRDGAEEYAKEAGKLRAERDIALSDAKQMRGQNVALIGERNTEIKRAQDAERERDNLKRRVVELERAEAMHRKAMLDREKRVRELEGAVVRHMSEAIEMCRQRDAASAELEQNQIPLGVQQAAALIDMIAEDMVAGRAPALRRLIPFLRELGIPVTKAGYETLSAAVHRLRAPSPTEQAQPVRDAATETKPANARRERARTRSRTQARTRKA